MAPPRKPLLKALEDGPLVVDGAMGTQLYERGVFINRSLEEACLSRPDLVRRIHQEYLDAGANVIQTHTFAANRLKLERHSLADQVADINRAAIRIAREAAEGRPDAYVAAAIGPTGRIPGVMTDRELDQLRDAFREQAELLCEGGADLIVLETFRLLSEMRLALSAVREVCGALPVVAQMAFDAEERTADGADPERVVHLLRDLGADVVGVNCVEGPGVVYRVAGRMVGHGVPISASPNAGYPRRQDDRLIYMATPEYFGVYARRFFKAGVSLVGGCCGTGPDHIQSVAAAARMWGGGSVQLVNDLADERPITLKNTTLTALDPVPMAQKTALAAKIDRVWRERVKSPTPVPLGPESFVVSVEVNPPSGLDPQKALDAARMLRHNGVDAINIADGPRASVRMSNQALALLTRRELDLEVILHVCCRDRNLLGLQSDLLANHVLGLHNLVVITGDPPKMGDYPHATAVFDLDSVGLLRLINNLNRGVDPAGKLVGQTTRFLCACGVEPAAADYDRELRRLERKRQEGAEFIMTQPVYDPLLLDRFLTDVQSLDMPVLVGLLPLASDKNAEFLHNEVPGMQIPQHIRDRMKQVQQGPDARAEGVRIAQETLIQVADRVAGAYIMPPFGRYSAALDILECVGFTRTVAA